MDLGSFELHTSFKASGEAVAQKAVLEPYFARLADKHQDALTQLAAAREFRKSSKRTYDDACAMFNDAKLKIMDCLDSDSDEDPSFIQQKVAKKEEISKEK
jgi:hypothetical protein